MRIELLKINKDTGWIELDSNFIAAYKPIRELFDRDTSRRKENAWAELYYAYLVGDPRSIPNKKGYGDKEAHEYAVKHANLNKSYEPDKMVRELTAFLRTDQVSTGQATYQSLLRGLHNTKRVVDRLNDDIEKLLAKDECDDKDRQLLFTLQDRLLKLAGDIPDKITTVQQAEESLQKDIDTTKKGKGGRVILDSMNPDLK